MNFVLMSGIKQSLIVSLVLLLLILAKDIQAQPTPCNCDPFDAACLAACDNGGATPPEPCNCDPFDTQCILDHPECSDGVPIDGNVAFLSMGMLCFGLYKLGFFGFFISRQKKEEEEGE